MLEGAALRAVEPALAEGLFAWRLETGRPVPPAAAANAFALRAHEAGATLQVGVEAFAQVENGRATGVTIDGVHHRRARSWSPPARGAAELTRACPFISPLWGVVVEFELPDAPRHVLEEAGIDALTQRRGAAERAVQRRDGARDLGDRVELHARGARIRTRWRARS